MKRLPKRTILDVLTLSLPIGLLAASVLGFLAQWPFELLAHFRWHYVMIATTLLLFSLFFKLYKTSAGQKAQLLLIIALGFNALLVGSLYWGDKPPSKQPAELTVLFSNVYYRNPNTQRLLPIIKEQDPDVVAMAEVTDQAFASFSAELKNTYPYAFHKREKRFFGVAIFSKHKPQNEEIVRNFSENALPSLQLDLIVHEKPVRVVVTHPYPPVAQWGAELRNEQLMGLANAVKDSRFPMVVVGDFNMTPWSSDFQRIVKQGGLKNSLVGAGFQPSWPTWLPIFFRIPIDHALVSPNIEVVDRYVLPNMGSDHRPILVKVNINE
jgi:endonuclease/exonuclease/phosphatase (EEP) superfamily protein YafD